MWRLIIIFLTIYSSIADDTAIHEFTRANNLFALSVYKEVTKSKNGNFLFSPFSAEAVLSSVQSGSRGKSAEELDAALHHSDQRKTETAVKSLLSKFRSRTLYSLYTANKIYLKENFTVKPDFKASGAEFEAIDFTTVDAADKINSWIESHTNNKIKTLVAPEDLDRYTRAILVNALYFKANWSNPFLVVNTQKQKFYKTPSDVVEVDTLNHEVQYFQYYECPHLEAQFLELPFQDREVSMVVVLPNKKDGLPSLEKQLEWVLSPQHELNSTFLNVALPKFRIETLIDLKTILTQLGVKKVFDEKEADLSGISGEPGKLYLKKVVQKTFIDVEEGVEAAAATVIYAAFPPSAQLEQPKNFIADHPFIFYIKVNDLVVFMGKVTDSTVPL